MLVTVNRKRSLTASRPRYAPQRPDAAEARRVSDAPTAKRDPTLPATRLTRAPGTRARTAAESGATSRTKSASDAENAVIR